MTKCENIRAFEKEQTMTQKPRIIKNKDILLLSRVLYTMQDIASLEKRQSWQKERLYSVTQNLSGMPSGKGPAKGFDSVYAAIDGLNEEQRSRLLAYTKELEEAEKIINGITSRTMRTFVLMMYVDGLSPDKVREELNMSEWGFRKARDSVEKAPDMQSVIWQDRYVLE